KKNNELVVLFSILLQGLFIIIMNNLIYSSSDINKLKEILPVVNIIIVLLVTLNIYSISSLQQTAEYRLKVILLKDHLKQVEALLQNLQEQRHQYGHHLQAIQSMVYLGREKEFKEYINGIIGGFRHSNEILYAGHPAITGLINTKSEIAKSQGIHFAAAVKCDLSKINIPSWDLCTILGNLIDNAFEASIVAKDPRVGIEFKREESNYTIYVINNGAIIAENEKDKIFYPGYSTKGYLARGYGLYLVKKIVDHYGGNIFLKPGKQITFVVQLPIVGVTTPKTPKGSGTNLRVMTSFLR
ncbi:MAG: ATP-binding protein, partial [Syntrophomonas sp.]